MSALSSYSSYRKAQVNTASPLTLVLLLYDEAIKNIQKGRAGLQDEDLYMDSASHLMKAVSIVTELVGIINPAIAPELAKGLAVSYQHVLSLLTDALKERDPAPLEKALEVMTALGSAWQEVAKKSERQAG